MTRVCVDPVPLMEVGCRWTTGATAALLLMLSAHVALALSPPPLRLPEKDLAAQTYTYVTTVAALPADVRETLARQLDQPQLEMADAGKPFNVRDAILDPKLPGRRLILAALGSRFALVHFESGGIAHTYWAVIFERTPAGMNVLLHTTIVDVYREPKQLEQAIKTGSLWKPSRSRSAH
jgi:hypothetical protein